MKNLKKLMSVVLSVVMLMSFVVSTSAATFADVAETDKAYEAVEVLAALKILEGKEAGAFDPEANIKRSEFAAVVCRAMNQESAAIGAANFTDVSADHWAAGYIGWAAAQGIVNGRGDGSFDPDANVSYNEAIAMIVRAMGYEWYVEEMLGGYPTGYARIAGSYKIDKDITSANGNAPATRADVATLVYNAFDAPLMDMSYSISSDAEYVIYNGSKNVDGEKRTLLSYYGDIYKVKASVETTYRNDSNLIDAKGNKYMSLLIGSWYGFDEEWVGDALNKTEASILPGEKIKVIANDDAWAGYQGYTVNAYVALNENDKLEVVAMVVDSRTAEELVIENARELIDESTIVGNKITFEYYEDADANRTKSADIAADYSVYVNNIAVPSASKASYFESLDDGAYASVTLLDSNGDGEYDKIYLTNYEYGIVEEVDADLEIIETTRTSYYLSADDTSDVFVYNIYKDGEQIALADLAEGDMLNIVIGDLSGNVEDATFVDIYVTNNVIESSVGSKSGAGTSSNPYRYVIDGEDYYLATGALVSDLSPGDTGSFYITIDGYIYDADFTSTYSDNYAFILNIASTNDGWGEKWEIKILDKNNTVKTIPVKKTVYVTDADASYAKKSLKSENAEYDAYFTTVAGRVHADTAAAAKSNIEKRFITFKESNGEITELVFPKSSSNDRDFRYNTLDANVKYSPKTGLLGGYEVDDTTYIFSVPTANASIAIADTTSGYTGKYILDEDLIQVYAIGNLDDETDYNGYVFNVDKDGLAGAAILTHNPGFAGNINALAVVRSVSEGLNAAGEPATSVEFWQGTEAAVAVVAENGFIGSNIFDGTITAGDVFQYTLNADGEINGTKLIYDYSAKKLMETTGSSDITFAVGVVNDITAKRLTYSNATGDNKSLAWDEVETNVLVDVARIAGSSSNAIKGYSSTSYIKGFSTKSVDWDGTGAGTEMKDIFASDVYVVVVKADDGAIVDVVTYKYNKESVAYVANETTGAYAGSDAASFVDTFTVAS